VIDRPGRVDVDGSVACVRPTAIVIALFATTTARAEPSPNAVRLEYGLGGPSGFVGARYVRQVGQFSIEPGVGYAATGPGASVLFAIQLRDPGSLDTPIRDRKVGIRAYAGASSFRTLEEPDKGHEPPKGQYYWLDVGLYTHGRLGPLTVVGGFNLAFLVGGPNRDAIGEGDDDFSTIGFLSAGFYVKEGWAPGIWGGIQFP
jgi:hypothetical protein